MARLASQAKAGYFPTPPVVTDLITSYLTAPHGGRILDPCAGTGTALVSMALALRLDAYGIEIHHERAQATDTALTDLATTRTLRVMEATTLRRTLYAAHHFTSASDSGFNLLFLNPPYDHDSVDGRLEYQFLRDCRTWLQPGGILVYVVPQTVFAFAPIAKHLSAWYTDLRLLRFPDAQYPAFGQAVLFGVRRADAITPQDTTLTLLENAAHAGEVLAPLVPAQQPLYTLPPITVPQGHLTFHSRMVHPEDALKEIATHGLTTTPGWQAHFTPQDTPHQTEIAPLMPLRVGHIAGVIAAGFLDNVVLHDPETDERLLIKGRVYKRKQVHTTVEHEEDTSREVTTRTEQLVTEIYTLNQQGEGQHLTGSEFHRFLHRWTPVLARRIATQFPPRYTFNYAAMPDMQPILDGLSLTRRIPRTQDYGLLSAQKHAAAALGLHLRSHRDALLVGEMSTGKTTVGTAVAALLNARRTLVLCPPHLVAKWKREVETVWSTCTAHILTTISEVQAFFALGTDHPRIGILSHSHAKLASGWRNAAMVWEPQNPAIRSHPRYKDYQARRGVRCPRCGALATDRQGFGLDPLRFERSAKPLTCRCGEPLFQFERLRSRVPTPSGFHTYVENEAVLCGKRRAPLHRPTTKARYPLARYIRRHHAGQVDLLLADEVHQFKGMDSDQGYAFADLAMASRKILGLTGTLFGGKASSIAHLLYRLSPEVRRAYTDTDRTGLARIRWQDFIEQYGVLQEIQTVALDPASGTLTANSRIHTRVRELPGASPALLPWLLNRTVFLSMSDLGIALPPYEEIPVIVPMSPPLAQAYTRLYGTLKQLLKERLRKKDKSLLGAYLQSLISWPDSPWRDEVVRDPRTRVPLLKLDALSDADFPKEQAIVSLIQTEKAQGRRCLLYVQQTQKRDITPYWVALLAARGIRAAVLRADPDKREAWITKQVAEGIDVILTHPKAVETGLDLIAFPTLIFMGTEYSIYTVMQASRRSWRIGQEEAVRVYFYAYANTLQHDALHLIAAKSAAAVRVNGEVIGDDSLAEMDMGGDILDALARIVAESDSTTPHPRALPAFANLHAARREADAFIGEPPLGSPSTVPSATSHPSTNLTLLPPRSPRRRFTATTSLADLLQAEAS
jgi:16S rRNA G966 N2-methylase RsmD